MKTTESRYSETADQNYTEDQLNAMSLTELKDLFNAEILATHPNPSAFKPVVKFSSKDQAVRRVFASLTVIPADDQDDDQDDVVSIHDIVNKVSEDFRLSEVTCVTCHHTNAKHTMTLVGCNWYCMDEDACEARLNPTTDPNEHNSPEGMVFCGLCKQHVPADTAEPTADAGIYTCKELCIGKRANSLKDKARRASASTTRAPKASKPAGEGRKVKFPADYIVNHVKPRNCRGFSLVAYSTIQDGMTVKEVCEAIAALETGAITGLSEIGYDVTNGYITVTAPNTPTPEA